MTPTAKRKRLDREAIFQKYYKLGDKRSLEKLHQICPNTSLRTLKNYSKEGGWQERVAKMDAKASEKATDKAIEIKAEKIFDARERYKEIAEDNLALLLKMTKAIAAKKDYDTADMVRVADVLDRAMAQIDALDESKMDREAKAAGKTSEERVKEGQRYWADMKATRLGIRSPNQ